MVQAVRHLPPLPEDLSARPTIWEQALLDECVRSAHERINHALDALFAQCEASEDRRAALEQAAILAELGPDAELVIAALLHPLFASPDQNFATATSTWGEGVVGLLESAQRLAFLQVGSQETDSNETQHENLRRMLLAMASDVRVVVLLLAERLYQLRHVRELSREEGQRIARETRDILAPLANRLGIWQLKWQLEDLAFRTLHEDEYLRIARALDERREDRDRYIQDVIATLSEKLKEAGIEGEISGRSKHIFSIWKKIQRKEASLDALYDLRAVRILVDNVTACYTALGLVHGLWPHIPKEFDDYIAAPKPNGYRSLHTAVRGPEGRILEVQIRTREMHDEAERGFAAHWRYKEGSAHDSALERKVLWLRQLLEWKEDVSQQEEFLERFSDAVAEEQIYVFSPRGEVIELPAGSTALDFAYAIHTELGHRTRGARADGRIVTLQTPLKTGQQIELLTAKEGRPSRDWMNPSLGFLATSRGRSRVKQWYRRQDREQNIQDGRALVMRELERVGAGQAGLEAAAECFQESNLEDFLAAVGQGDITVAQLAGRFARLAPKPVVDSPQPVKRKRPRRANQTDGVRIEGVGNLLTHYARCCGPVPGDAIVGFISQGRGVSVHRRDCSNALRLMDVHPERMISVDWGQESADRYVLDLDVRAHDRSGLLRDITGLLADEKVNVLGANTSTDRRTHLAHIRLTVEIGGVEELARLLQKIAAIPNVLSAERSRN